MTPQQQHICQLLRDNKEGRSHHSWRTICEIVGADPNNCIDIIGEANLAEYKHNKNVYSMPSGSSEKWHKVADKTPPCYRSWPGDGVLSDRILFRDKKGEWYLGYCVSGILDGNKYTDFIDSAEFQISDVTEWASLNEFI